MPAEHLLLALAQEHNSKILQWSIIKIYGYCMGMVDKDRTGQGKVKMEELFNIIGKLYVDIYNTQKVLDMLQKQIQEQDAEIVRLKQTRTKDE